MYFRSWTPSFDHRCHQTVSLIFIHLNTIQKSPRFDYLRFWPSTENNQCVFLRTWLQWLIKLRWVSWSLRHNFCMELRNFRNIHYSTLSYNVQWINWFLTAFIWHSEIDLPGYTGQLSKAFWRGWLRNNKARLEVRATVLSLACCSHVCGSPSAPEDFL